MDLALEKADDLIPNTLTDVEDEESDLSASFVITTRLVARKLSSLSFC